MPCSYRYGDLCPTHKHYIAAGSQDYHGELCDGCLWWTDNRSDLAFKRRDELLRQQAGSRRRFYPGKKVPGPGPVGGFRTVTDKRIRDVSAVLRYYDDEN